MPIVRDVAHECGDRRRSDRSYDVIAGITSVLFVTGLLLAVVSPLLAQPGKAKEASTKQSAVAELKPEAAASSSAKVPVDPATCLKPGDAEASQNAGNEKSSASSSAISPASDSGAAAESASQSSTEFMKDKLKLSIGGKGKAGSASDEPLQCGVDEAGSQAKESDPSPSK